MLYTKVKQIKHNIMYTVNKLTMYIQYVSF